MNPFIRLTVLSVVASAFGLAATTGVAKDRPQTGRFQLTVNYDGTMFLLDTATGQCWTKARGGEWVDAGNPAKPKPKIKTRPKTAPATSPIEISLPGEKAELTIKQRNSKAIPGSNGRVLIYVDDITRGQSLISIRDDAGAILLDATSAREGSILEFRVNKRRYFLYVKTLMNFVIGEDFAILEVGSRRAVLGRKPVRQKKEPETPKRKTPKPEQPKQEDAPPEPATRP